MAVLYITHLFDNATDIVHDFIALQVTAVHGYFDEIWTTKITARELVVSGATIDQAHIGILCVKKSDHSEICITGNQLEVLLSSAPIRSVPSSESISTNKSISTSSGNITPVTDSPSTNSGATTELSGSILSMSNSGTTDSGSIVKVINSGSTDSGMTTP